MFSSSSNLADFVTVISGALSSPRTTLRSTTFEPFSYQGTVDRDKNRTHAYHAQKRTIYPPSHRWVDGPLLLSMVCVGSILRMINSILCEKGSAIAWWVGGPRLSMVCVGSIPSINFCLNEKAVKVLDLRIVRGEGRAPKITVAKSARFDELENIYFVGRRVQSPGVHSHVTMWARW